MPFEHQLVPPLKQLRLSGMLETLERVLPMSLDVLRLFCHPCPWKLRELCKRTPRRR